MEKEIVRKGEERNSLAAYSEFLTITEVGQLLKISRITIWKYRKAGILRAVTIGSRVRFARADIDALTKCDLKTK